ncbi:MAG: DNA topoisomerase III [Clostridia bacterium]|nr:DNA topoisomerase III [Clostridia bacterium]
MITVGQVLVLAEKPSVGRDIARVLQCTQRGNGCMIGNGYTVTWAVGHLVTLMEPDEMDAKYKKWSNDTLPILPDSIPLKVISTSRDQYKIVKDLMNAPTTDSLICATDAGREGELIFRYIYEKTGCKKPFRRLWINSMTDEAIKEGFKEIKPGSAYDGLYRSAKCRSEADWLVGMNASRAFTLRYHALLSVGRVQTPTLAILVRRRKEIENFKPEGFCTVTADFGDFKGIWFKEGQDSDTHLKTKEEAQAIIDKVKGKTATIISCDTQHKRELPPQLYDLTSLQRDANRMLGYTADKTLKLAQSLYETHKAFTYPRTDSRYLPPDMVPKVEQTFTYLPQSMQSFIPGATPGGHIPVTKRTIDASKVTDHHAIIPTPKRIDLSKLSPDERQLYDLVSRRTIAAFYPAYEYDWTKVVSSTEGETFRSTGRVVTENGWCAVPPLENPPRIRKSKKDTEENETALPPLQAGDTRLIKSLSLNEDTTKPPALHTDATLLSAMENAGKESDDEEIVRQMKGSGIGTPATRAAIIERIIKVGYAERKGKNLLATDKGVQLIDLMPDEISSAETTGRWELALDQITDGKQDANAFMESIRKFSTFLVSFAQTTAAEAAFPEETRWGRGKHKGYSSKKIADCKCPLCGKGAVLESDRAFACSEYGKTCYFTLWKDCLTRGGGPELNEKLFKLILEKKHVQGSTGTILLSEGFLSFYRIGDEIPSAHKSLIYKKPEKVK